MPPPQANQYEITYLASLFAAHNQYPAISIESDGFLFKNFKGKKRLIHFLEIESTIEIESGWFWV